MSEDEDRSAEIELTLSLTSTCPRYRRLARVSGVPGDVIQSILTAQERRWASGGDYGYRSQTRLKRFFEVDNQGVIWIGEGLVERLTTELRDRGWTVNVTKRYGCPEEPPHRGQVIFPDKSAALEWLRDEERELEKTRLLIVTRNGKDRKWLLRRLKRASSRFLTRDPFQSRPGQGVTAVVSTDYFGRLSPGGWKVVIFWGSEAVLSEQVQGCLEKYLQTDDPSSFPPALYCIHTGVAFSRMDQLTVEQACGPVLLDARWPDNSQPLEVAVIQYPDAVVVTEGLSALELKRKCIWRNGQRNRLIADVVTAIKAGDPDVIERIGISQLTASSKIAIVVESPEHARELAALLPDWRLLSLTEDAQGAVPGDAVDDYSLVTELYFAESACLVDIVVRASGGCHPWRWPQDKEETVCHEPQLGLIDFGEIGHNGLDRDTRARIRDYEQRNGWVVSIESRSW